MFWTSGKKLGLIDAIFLTVSTMLGAGIFIRTKILNRLAHNNTWAVMILLILGIFMILSLLISLSFIVSKQTSAQGYLEWTKKYCPKWVNILSINYTRMIYQPLSLFLIGTYIVELLKNEYSLNVWYAAGLSFLIVLCFMIINLLSFEFANWIQMLLLFVVFIPLLILPILGIYTYFYQYDEITKHVPPTKKPTSLDAMGPWMVLISGLPSLFFMYDGFYTNLSLRDKLKNPNNLKIALIFAFIFVTAIYSYLIFAFKIGAPHTGNFLDFPMVKNCKSIRDFFNVTIICAALLTLNSVSMSNVRQLVALNQEYKFKDIEFINKFFSIRIGKNPKGEKFNSELNTWLYLIFKAIVWYFIIAGISQLIDWIDGKEKNLWNINDAITDVVSSLIFTIIAVVIINLTKTFNSTYKEKHMKFYKYASYFSGIMIFLSLAYTYLNYLFGIFGFYNSNKFLSAFKLIISLSFVLISSHPYIKKWVLKIIYIRDHKIFNLGKGGDKYSIVRYKD